MNYDQAIEYLYAHAPMFQNIGTRAYKTGLDTTRALDEHFHHPHRRYHTIHVAGTNGKGSTSHLIASVLQAAGYKVGLYTSPHLRDFRERIRINGRPISKQAVTNFIRCNTPLIEQLQPSFFEITTAMAFNHFAKQHVDIAVIEVGLGGLLDCTNIIRPLLSIITNISYDHMNILGNTLEEIAAQKAGIIKPRTPVIIGEYQNASIKNIFLETAKKVKTPIIFAQEKPYPTPPCQLQGIYQEKNTQTVIHAIYALLRYYFNFIRIPKNAIRIGFAEVIERTGLQGRWQQLATNPTILCDTGHNEGGFHYIVQQLRQQHYRTLRIILGMVSDKDINAVLVQLPKNATYYFTKASIPRALDEHKLQAQAAAYQLYGGTYPTVREALRQAKKDADKDDFIFIGGSNFVVAEIL